MTPVIVVSETDPKKALLSSFSAYWAQITGGSISVVTVGDWSPVENETTTVQAVSSSIVKVDREGFYYNVVLLVRNIKTFTGSEEPSDDNFNKVKYNLMKDKKISYSGKDFYFSDCVFNSPIRVNGGSAIEGLYDSGLLESENVITTSAIYSFNIYG